MKLGLSLFALSIAISVLLLNPTIKKKSMSWLLEMDKKVLSQLEFKRDQQTYKVIKVQNARGLAVELYKIESDHLMFLDAKQLTDKKDAYYRFGETKHNLFLKDINGDGEEDIVLPSLDKNMKARLNIYIFNVATETLEKVTQH